MSKKNTTGKALPKSNAPKAKGNKKADNLKLKSKKKKPPIKKNQLEKFEIKGEVDTSDKIEITKKYSHVIRGFNAHTKHNPQNAPVHFFVTIGKDVDAALKNAKEICTIVFWCKSISEYFKWFSSVGAIPTFFITDDELALYNEKIASVKPDPNITGDTQPASPIIPDPIIENKAIGETEKSITIPVQTIEEEAPEKPVIIPDGPRVFDIKSTTSFLAGKVRLLAGFRVHRKDDTQFVFSGTTEAGKMFENIYALSETALADQFFEELCKYDPSNSKLLSEPTTALVSVDNADLIEVDLNTVPVALPKEIIQTTPAAAQQGGNKFQQPMVEEKSLEEQVIHYGQAILKVINSSFKVKMHKKMPLKDFQTYMNTKCSKAFKYDLQKDEGGYFLMISANDFSARVPEDKDTYLPIS